MIKKLLFSIALFALMATPSVVAKQYSVAQIYDQMCASCHGEQAEGNPEKKGPALNDMSQKELSYTLFELVGNGSQSSGTGHDIMEHNQKKIMEKGMNYHPDDMALYIYSSFGPGKNKQAGTANVQDSQGIRAYSVSEIYKRMCSKCHGMEGEGNPEKKGPSLNDMTKNELEMELYYLQSDGFQSSGVGNDVMVHNQNKIEDKGMIYHPEDMASYIYFHFNQDANK